MKLLSVILILVIVGVNAQDAGDVLEGASPTLGQDVPPFSIGFDVQLIVPTKDGNFTAGDASGIQYHGLSV